MHGYISDLHWVMPQCTYFLCTIFIPYVESQNWLNAKNLTSYEFPNEETFDLGSHPRSLLRFHAFFRKIDLTVLNIRIHIKPNANEWGIYKHLNFCTNRLIKFMALEPQSTHNICRRTMSRREISCFCKKYT